MIDSKFLEGEENLSLLIKQMGEEVEFSEEAKLSRGVSQATAEVNRVDENKVITVFVGSESPGKNGKFVAEDICAQIRKRGFHVDSGGPINLDNMLGHERFAEGGEIRKKAIVVVSTAGVGEFPDGSKGFAKEVFGPKIEANYEDEPVNAEVDLGNVDFAVFGLGDTNYHPAEKHLVDSFGS